MGQTMTTDPNAASFAIRQGKPQKFAAASHRKPDCDLLRQATQEIMDIRREANWTAGTVVDVNRRRSFGLHIMIMLPLLMTCPGTEALAQSMSCNAPSSAASSQSALQTPAQSALPGQSFAAAYPAMPQASAPSIAPPGTTVSFPPPILGPQQVIGPIAGEPPSTSSPSDRNLQQPPTVDQLTTPQQPPAAQPSSSGLSPSGSTNQPGNTQTTGLTPAFIDTFSGSSIDQSKWGFNYPWSDTCDTNGNTDPTQYAAYASPNCNGQPNPFTIGSNGLDISIKSGNVAGKSAVTGQIYSKQAFQYGYFEMTAKLPTTTGVGAAFWFMPQGGGWPPELDVMESLGQDPSTVYGTIHEAGAPQQQVTSNVSGGSGSGFHNYGVDWEPDKITWYTDGVATRSVATPASFHQPMYMILSVNSSPPGDTNWGSPIDTSKAVNDNYQVKSVVTYAKNPYTAL